MIPDHIEQSIKTFKDLGKDVQLVGVVSTIAKRENISIPDALKMYKTICEMIGRQSIQDVYAVYDIARALNQE